MVNQQQILEKAIKKAIDNGYSLHDWVDSDKFRFEIEAPHDESVAWVVAVWGIADFDEPDARFTMREIIFSHDFAKALWGSQPMHEFAWGESVKSFDGEKTEYDFQVEDVAVWSNWKYHLQQMVIADDPIKYLGENL